MTIRELIVLLAQVEDATRDAKRTGTAADLMALARSERAIVAALRRRQLPPAGHTVWP